MAAQHKFVVRHVRFWRGKIQRWSTVYQYWGTPLGGAIILADLQTMYVADNAMNFSTAATQGGIYQIECYDTVAGGIPVMTANYFDPESPAAWTGYAGNVWLATGRTFEPVAETALGIRWPAGISKTGKQVYLRKWFHSVPTSVAAAGVADVGATDLTALTTAAVHLRDCFVGRGMSMGVLPGTVSGAPQVSAYYENHQMPRGRRRKALVSASGKYQGPTIDPQPLPVIGD